MKFKDYYKIMEVASNASQEEIKQAYHRLARKFHPDISKEPNAEQRFKEINEAYEVLKDPQKRAAYHSSFKLILPYTYAWFIAKKDAWMRTNAQLRAKKDAGMRAKFLGRSTKKDANMYAHTRAHSIEDSSMKSTQKFPLILMGIFVLVLSAITMAVIFAVEQLGQLQNHQQIQKAILQGEKTAIEYLERSDIENQRKIIADEQIKKAVIQFYLQQNARPVFALLETYDDTIEIDILRNNAVYHLLKTHYYHLIEGEIKTDNFNKALSLLDTLKSKYPSSGELSDKYDEIESQKQERLAELTQQYTECSKQTLVPLLEKTHCMMEARQQIEYVDIEYNLPSTPNLQVMYTKEIRYALAEKNFERVEKLLLDWQTLLPIPSKQREKLQNNLLLYRQIDSIIADLGSDDRNKILKRLSQLTTIPALQQELLKIPHLQDNLLRYYLKETLILIKAKNEDVKINPKTMALIEQILLTARGSTPRQSEQQQSDSHTPQYVESASSPPFSQTNQEVAEILQKCQEHYDANRLTTGKPDTALNCYKTLLKKEPGNLEAMAGLKAIENRYKMWANYALQQNNLDKVKVYIANLEKVNPTSENLAPLRKRLTMAIARSKPTSLSVKVPPSKQLPSSSLVPPNCEDCNCSDLFKQISMGLERLTPAQSNFFQTQCRSLIGNGE